MRISDHDVFGELEPKPSVTFSFNGVDYEGRDGEPIAVALLANGVRALRESPVDNEPRGVYCGIGHCYECRVWVDDQSQVRACLTPVVDGATYSSERGAADGSK